MLKIKKETLQNTKELNYAVLIKSSSKQQQLVDIVLDMQTIFHEVGSLEDIEYAKLIRIDECCDLL